MDIATQEFLLGTSIITMILIFVVEPIVAEIITKWLDKREQAERDMLSAMSCVRRREKRE